MNKQKTLAERLGKMKSSIQENKHILSGEFPDDITTVGNPKFIAEQNVDDVDYKKRSEENE